MRNYFSSGLESISGFYPYFNIRAAGEHAGAKSVGGGYVKKYIFIRGYGVIK